jgi:hypothetical protein
MPSDIWTQLSCRQPERPRPAAMLNTGPAAVTDAARRWRPTLLGIERGSHHLGRLKRDRPAMADDAGTDLRQPVAQGGERPLLDSLGQHQGAPEVGEVIGQRAQLPPHGVSGQDAADRVRPTAGPGSTTARRAASGDLRLPRVHPLLRVDPGRPVHRHVNRREREVVDLHLGFSGLGGVDRATSQKGSAEDRADQRETASRVPAASAARASLADLGLRLWPKRYPSAVGVDRSWDDLASVWLDVVDAIGAFEAVIRCLLILYDVLSQLFIGRGSTSGCRNRQQYESATNYTAVRSSEGLLKAQRSVLPNGPHRHDADAPQVSLASPIRTNNRDRAAMGAEHSHAVPCVPRFT